MPRSAAWARPLPIRSAACSSTSPMKSPDFPLVSFKLDGREVQAIQGETILQAADRLGVSIPRLCYKDGYRPDGNCRSCVVEVGGERVLAPSCCRAVTAGMDVKAQSDRARKSQKRVVEMLLSDMPDRGYKWNDGNDDPGEGAADPGQQR